MNKNTRKGFTITELVIVIAVIAILAAVLIPTFSNIIKKANDSSDLQTARNIMIQYVAQEDAKVPAIYYVKVDNDTYYKVDNGEISKTPVAAPPAAAIIVDKPTDATATITTATQPAG